MIYPNKNTKKMLSSPIFPIERAILDGFGKVLGSDRIGLVKIRNGSGDFQDAIIGPGGQAKAIGCFRLRPKASLLGTCELRVIEAGGDHALAICISAFCRQLSQERLEARAAGRRRGGGSPGR